MIELGKNDLPNLYMVGDRLLIKPKSNKERTRSGLYLPPTVQENEQLQSGYVIKAGPGYPIPDSEPEEHWKPDADRVKYLPLQAQEGDWAVYMQKGTFDVEINNEKYVIVPHQAILMILRDKQLFQ